jgi:hypothetical protein
LYHYRLKAFWEMTVNLILCATDAGGVRNLAPLVAVAAAQGLRPIIWTTPERLALWGEHVLKGELHLVGDLSFHDLAGLLEAAHPRACICGTTRFDSPERLLLRAARETGVRSVVVLDEWYNYRQRFAQTDTNTLAYLPDAVAVPDRQAREEAAAEGVPADLCQITGSPALAELTRRARGFAAAPPEPPEFLREVKGRPVITYLSETHASDYGTGPDAPGLLGPYIGYTEITVRQAILELLARWGAPVILVEKLHPAASVDQEKAVCVPSTVDFHVTRQTDLWALMWHSQIIIGMRSMALLEANILGCEAISFQPGLIGPQRCTAVRLGLIPHVERLDDLADWMAPRLKLRAAPPRIIGQYDFARSDAADRVIAVALNQRAVI